MSLPYDLFKVVVTGAFNSGKTTFIKTISEIEVVSTELVDNTEDAFNIALDFGWVIADQETILYLFGTPAARRFEVDLFAPMLQPPERAGFVVLINASMPRTWLEASGVLAEARRSSCPHVIGINQWDGRMPLEGLRTLFALQDDEIMLPCNVVNYNEVAYALLELFAQFPHDDALIRLCEKLIYADHL